MITDSHTLNPTSTGDNAGQLGQVEMLARAKRHADAGDSAGIEHYRAAAEDLTATWKAHKTPQRAMAVALGRSQSWVAQLLQWHREGCPAGGPFLRVNLSSRTTQRTKSKSPKRKATASPANRLFEAANAFYESELAGADDKMFDRVMKMFEERRQAAKAQRSQAVSVPIVKIGKETLRSLDGFGEDAKRQIAAAVAGNDVPPETSKEERSAYYAAEANDDLSIPTFLRREPVSGATA